MEFQKFKKIPRLSRDMCITEKIDGTNGQICIFNFRTLSDWFEKNTGLGSKSYMEEMYEFVDKYSLYQTLALTDEDDINFLFAGSRKRWLSVDNGKNCDNHGFARWVKENTEELLKLGEGRHFGEFYGKDINRNYGLDEKRFALFNINKWHNYNKEKRLISINPQTNEEKYTISAPKCCEVVPVLYEGLFDTQIIQKQLDMLADNGSVTVTGYKDAEGICIWHSVSGQLFKKTIENDSKPKSIL